MEPVRELELKSIIFAFFNEPIEYGMVEPKPLWLKSITAKSSPKWKGRSPWKLLPLIFKETIWNSFKPDNSPVRWFWLKSRS
jgi:hypothetical protein